MFWRGNDFWEIPKWDQAYYYDVCTIICSWMCAEEALCWEKWDYFLVGIFSIDIRVYACIYIFCYYAMILYWWGYSQYKLIILFYDHCDEILTVRSPGSDASLNDTYFRPSLIYDKDLPWMATVTGILGIKSK